MTAFFRDLGAKGRSPVEFQIEKARAGDLKYSRRHPLIDYLLFAEVFSGYLIGLHDLDAVGDKLVYGLAKEASKPEFEHISRKQIELKPDEPVLIADDQIIASLRHGPDYATRVQDSTTAIWGVMFASPDDSPDEADRALTQILDEGVERGIWALSSR
jgi:DNA/RNA-binding domain of Phe-tRNA-synthetase-like protein